ncbi:MAG TPA: RsmE family RNA methyltransferase [Gemmatimonadales bacterium]
MVVPAGAARPGALIPLGEDEAHHLRVRRADDGETVELRDGAGLSGTGVLERSGRGWSVRVAEARHLDRPSDLVLAVGAGDRDRFAWLVEKAAELGVTAIVPLETERTRGVASRVLPSHAERLGRRALEATKQSGAHWSPSVEAPQAYDAFVGRPRIGARWLADPAGAPPGDIPGPVSVLVGPEGGLTGPERDAALAAGWQAIALGAHTLRFETAAIAAAAYVAIARGRRG